MLTEALHARLEKEAIEAEIKTNSYSNTTGVAFTPTYKVNNVRKPNGSEIRKSDPIGRIERVSKGWNLEGQGQAWFFFSIDLHKRESVGVY